MKFKLLEVNSRHPHAEYVSISGRFKMIMNHERQYPYCLIPVYNMDADGIGSGRTWQEAEQKALENLRKLKAETESLIAELETVDSTDELQKRNPAK